MDAFIEYETKILETGWTNHIIGNKNLLSSPDHSFQSSINIGDKSTLEVIEKGHMEVQIKEGTRKVCEIYYTPKIK